MTSKANLADERRCQIAFKNYWNNVILHKLEKCDWHLLFYEITNCKPGSKWVLEAICSHWSHLSDQYSAADFKSNMWVKQSSSSVAGAGCIIWEWKDQRKQGRMSFSSHENTQDVSQLTFAWLVFFVHQPPTKHKHWLFRSTFVLTLRCSNIS